MERGQPARLQPGLAALPEVVNKTSGHPRSNRLFAGLGELGSMLLYFRFDNSQGFAGGLGIRVVRSQTLFINGQGPAHQLPGRTQILLIIGQDSQIVEALGGVGVAAPRAFSRMASARS